MLSNKLSEFLIYSPLKTGELNSEVIRNYVTAFMGEHYHHLVAFYRTLNFSWCGDIYIVYIFKTKVLVCVST